MAIKLTKAQDLAVNTAGGVLVSAAAGSGKTAVLAERVIRKLTDPVNPVSADRLLIVTFTKAAAAEMRARIEKRLFEECRLKPNDALLLRQSRLISSAKICTIDSFCIDLVRANFEKCGVQPDFTVSDGSDLSAIDSAVMKSIILRELENNTPQFQALLELNGCEYDEKKLTENIIKVFLYSRQLPFPQVYLNTLKRPYKLPFNSEHPWQSAAFEILKAKLSRAEALAASLADAALLLEKGQEKCIAFSEGYISLLNDLSLAAAEKSWDGVFAALSVSVGKQPSLSRDDPAAEVVRDCHKQLKDILTYLRDLFSQSSAQLSEEISRLLPAVELFVDLVNEYAERLFEKYCEENTLTFYNTEQLALGLLCEYKNGTVQLREDCSRLSSAFDEIMVDEFQDVNDLQDMLFEILSEGGKKLFLVGDVKQSIYGFRGSNPKNFLRRKRQYAPVSQAGAEKKKIILADNFRSRDGVCSFVNYFFSLFLQGQVSDIIYNEEERLNPAALFPESTAAPVQLVMVSGDDESEDSLLKQEAAALAEYIKNAVNEPPFIRDSLGGLRKAEYSDFAVLLNAVSGKASVISEELKLHGIPVAYNSETFLETVEVKTFLSLLRVIGNPQLDVELLTVMLSPIFGFTAQQLAEIRTGRRGETLFSSLIYAEKQGDRRVGEFLKSLASMRQSAAVLSVGRLVAKLLEDTDYLNIVSAMPQGASARENLLTLLRLAVEFSQKGRTGVSEFAAFVAGLPEKGQRSSAVGGGVRIMSMHASKGLQFPVCIIADISSKMNRENSIAPMLCSERNGIGFRYTSESLKAVQDTLPHKLNSKAAAVENIEERLRLLYVAMTRAEDRLVIISSSKDRSAQLSNISKKIENGSLRIDADWLASTLSMNDWVLAAALLHPDGAPLRKICDNPPRPQAADGSHIEIIFSSPAQAQSTPVSESPACEADPALQNALRQSFSYTYPYEYLCKIPSKASASQLAKQAENDAFAYSEKPAFMEKDGISAADKGTAVHRVMQFLDFNDTSDIEAQLRRMADFGFITEKQFDCADRSMIAAFLNSELFARIKRSPDVRREMRFLTELPAARFAEAPSTDNSSVVVQGAVDLCFVEDGAVVVVDFKTDRVKTSQELSSAYSKQLDIYAEACRKIFEMPVKEKIIYSFALSTAISL